MGSVPGVVVGGGGGGGGGHGLWRCGSCAGKILVSGNVESVTSGVCGFLRGCAWLAEGVDHTYLAVLGCW